MALEIEHKFLLCSTEWQKQVQRSIKMRQGYLNSAADMCSVRVRTSDTQAWINVKSATAGTQRQEYEYLIPYADGAAMLEQLAQKPLIEKTRFYVNIAPHTWEIDVFEGDNKGLVVAEIELSQVGEKFQRPAWLAKEVTDDIRYYNTSLAKKPYCNW